MADLGTIAIAPVMEKLYKRAPYWAASPTKPVAASVDSNGTLSGAVKEAGVAVPYAVVRLYYRPNGILIDQALCDASGLFSFSGIEEGVSDYYVIALDPDGGTQYNAVIFDRLSPV